MTRTKGISQWFPLALGVIPGAVMWFIRLHYHFQIDLDQPIDANGDWREVFTVVGPSAATLWAITFAVLAIFNVSSFTARAAPFTRHLLVSYASIWNVALSGFWLVPFILSVLVLIPNINGFLLSVLSFCFAVPWFVLVAWTMVELLRAKKSLAKLHDAGQSERLLKDRGQIIERLLPYLPDRQEIGRPSIRDLQNEIPLETYNAPAELVHVIKLHNEDCEKHMKHLKITLRSMHAVNAITDAMDESLPTTLVIFCGFVPCYALNFIGVFPTVAASLWTAFTLLVLGLALSVRMFVAMISSRLA